MKATSANFLGLIKGPKQFVIPIYQRTYSWQIPQCSKLLYDILRISKDPSVPGHFIGSVVYFQESIHTVSDVPKLLVIDGQQRLTTVSLLIAALSEFIRDKKVEIETNHTKLQNYYLLNPEEDSELRYKLLLTRRDKGTLIEIIKGIPVSDNPSQRILENFKYFKSNINIDNAVAIYNGILKLFVVDVALEKEKDNPQLIFESLNSTGLDLSQADLVRNYILMGQEIESQTELYEKFWYPMEQSYGNDYTTYFDSFMRDYLSVKTSSIPRIDRVYDEFKTYIQTKQAALNLLQVVEEIAMYSGYYVNMILHKEPDSELRNAFKNISRLKVDVSYPYLLPIYNDYKSGKVTKGDFVKIINLVENYVFRRAVCGIPTNSLNKTFSTLYREIRNENYFESVLASFQLLESYKRFPSDTEFAAELLTKDVYNFRSRNYLLNKLENFNRKESVNVDDYTIEHILPQNPELSQEWRNMLGPDWKKIQEQYLHTIGNLTLTGYNSELSDRPFDKKKTIEGGFNDSPIRLNDFLRKIEVWNKENILIRAQELAEKATLIWECPNLSEQVLKNYRKQEKEELTYTLEHYQLVPAMMNLYLIIKKRILNIDSSVKEEYKKLYIAFKSITNFVDIVPQKSRLLLILNLEYSEIVDPKGLSRDITGLGRWGNGNVEVGISKTSELDDAMELIQQAFDTQMEFQ
jgi:uncharacterized protein with ParB-like and HNH nuclease domain/predicted transport protein